MKKNIFLFTVTVIVAFCAPHSSKAQNTVFPYQNYSLTFEERVADLVSRMTLEEKVSQMLNSSPAIPRLQIPAYDWWNETLHGVARTPFRVTVYPQAIAMAATFDSTSLFKMAHYSALEGRAIYNKAVETERTNERYLGLTYWTPNINIFRDPRWGRGQETYGEDPFLTSMLGDAFVRGLQGNDSKYLLAAACAKHYAVHSGPEPSRHVFDVDVNAYDLWDTYLPAFKKLVVDSKVAGVMCAYNAFRTQPCCASDILMTDILRNQWGFKGYVTSDCWAIDDFFKNHKTHPNAASASADAVFHGTDLDCGTEAYKALVTAVKEGLIKESQIDVSVERLFMIRFRLGMFDPPALVKYAQMPISKLEAPEHKAHALKMAQQSIVLLKNQNKVLPLSKSLKKIVVLGPNADNSISILGNYNGIPTKLTTILQGIKDKVGKDTEIVYEKAVNFTNDTLLVYRDLSRFYSFENTSGFKAEYFNNKELNGNPVISKREKDLNHLWQEGEKIEGVLNANNFSARYVTDFKAEKSESLTFELEADDGYRFYINNKLLINAWTRNRWGAKTLKFDVKKDSTYALKVEYWQGEGKGNVRLSVGDYQRTDFNALIQRTSDADVYIFVGGISPQLEGEEMTVNYPGFLGGDRTSIMLPKVQTDLMKAINQTGKPLVFVMMTGSAIATPWESENVPAIVNAWYGGQAAGEALSDVIFGDYNPAGRLPITFYKSDADLASFEDYGMANRTYRYFKGTPLYGFGYGLSYTNFKYSGLKISKNTDDAGLLNISVKIKNTGALAGEEVPQLYLKNQNSEIKTALKSLKGFKRISLKSGETKRVSFTLTPQDLSYVDESGESKPLNGSLNLFVGGSQPDEKNETTSNTVKKTLNIR